MSNPLPWIPITIRSLVVATIVFVVSTAQIRASDTILAGWDLFESVPDTDFFGVPFTGLPLGDFDFGSGLTPVGSTDTIVRRLAPGTGPSAIIPVQLVALHLQSVVPVDFGLGLGTYYVTLQSERGGPSSVGNTTINFGPEAPVHGTFNSFFDVFFDIRLGSPNGPIALSEDFSLTSTGSLWSHDPSGLAIEGVNLHLNGLDADEDFFLVGLSTQRASEILQHLAPAQATPDGGSTLLLCVLGLLSVLTLRNQTAKAGAPI